jgi:hypothetical protein
MQATAKAKRRSSIAQCNNQPTTKWRTPKVANEKGVAHRIKEEEQQRVMQQPTNDYSR